MLTLGAILAGLAFLAFGSFHIVGRENMTGYIAGTLPVSPAVASGLNLAATVFLLATGALLIFQQAFAAYAAAAYLAGVSVLFHWPSSVEDQDNVQIVLKHVGWAGALLIAAQAL